jgi:hypothetical protein
MRPVAWFLEKRMADPVLDPRECAAVVERYSGCHKRVKFSPNLELITQP